ncbi:hypothetical protein K449DRAFT_402810 [Hypoxylon sp. EC38]|nr:hypothetical protein K449DRAFT_402810 [Hypoxylon sp. EC38]
MEHDHVINIDLEKNEYDQTSQDEIPSIISPATNDKRANKHTLTASKKSCIVCRKTLLLSYFNCCAVCLGITECRRGRKPTSESASLPITEPIPTEPPQGAKKPPHCDSQYCRYTHIRPIMILMIFCEAIHSGFGVALLNMSLYSHNFAMLRFAGLVLLQWWQIFVLPRQCACGQSIVTGQLVAVVFMVWFYVDGSRNWKWWEPFVICTVLLKIVFPW